MAECPVGAIEMSGGVALIDPEVCIGCGKCFDVCPVDAVKFEKIRRKGTTKKTREAPQGAFTDYRGVAVFIEVFNGQGATVSWELTGKARELAEKLQTKVMGFLLGHETESIAREAIAYGCDEVHVIDDPSLKTYLSKPYGKALADLCRKREA